MSAEVIAENEELKMLLWRTFVSFQLDVLSVVPKDKEVFKKFLDGEVDTPPFVKGSESYRICELCEKV